MTLEKLVSSMMSMSVNGRLWHWTTDVAQHHTTYENFLTQNEQLTDSLVESALGNDYSLNFSQVGVKNAVSEEYSLEHSKNEIKKYRSKVLEMKTSLSDAEAAGSEELVTILDDVTELSSKTLYMLKLK